MAETPTLVSLGAGRQQLPLIEAARAAGLRVVSVDRDRHAPGHRFADLTVVQSTHEPEAVLATLHALPENLAYRGIVCRSTGHALETQAHLAAALGLRGLTPEAVRIATSKSELRRFCLRHRLPMPRGERLSADARVQVPLPVVVKPDYTLVGKRDVRRVVSSRVLPEAVADAASSSWNGLAEVECFVDGIDVACVFWAERGRAHVLAMYDEVIGFGADGAVIPLGVSAPTMVDDHGRARVEDLAMRFAAHLPKVAALLILCVRVDGTGLPHVIELHADLGGDRIAEELLPASIEGFDYFRMVVDLATGADPRAVAERVRVEGKPVAVLYRGDESEGGSHLDATRIVEAPDRARMLAELDAEVRRRGTSVAVPPPVLRLGRAG